MATTVIRDSRVKRNYVYISLVVVGICAAMGYLLISMSHIAKQKKQAHAHTFFQYVVTHHIGTLTEVDDGTGLDPQSYVLNIPNPISPKLLPAWTENLMRLYYQYDDGSTLSVFANEPHQKSPVEIAQAYYDGDNQILMMTILSGKTQSIKEHIVW